ncbi:MAG: DUF4919 domain-containing protein [Alistipes sp.]|nr:DUF4919 domain-containing protein [Rikenellaceae bacterium]MBO4994224.1 DUF4919 domain-containing protein [Alistipes sp.]MBP3473459.1 DUF4919 domain-containing protein [Alistipes sp.]MBQ4540221.1 DUF4919 domain-containing protein [Alistipes sp.]
MKRLLLLLAVLVPALGFAKIPDDEDILRKIMDSSSPFYYTNLMMRYENLEKLSEEEYHYLYYGYAYHENYKPTATNKAVEDLYASMIGLNADRPDSKQIEYIISVCNEAMMVDPFSPTVLNMLVFAYGSRGDKVREEAYFYHLQGILETIKSSGDGRTEKYPMHIIMFSHAVDVVSSMGVAAKRPEIISRSVEYIPLEEPRRVPDGKIRGFYFDYSRIYRNKPEDVTFKKKRTWQFNNLGPREYK